MKNKAPTFEEDIRLVEQLPNDQNALDTMKTRIDKVAYEVAFVKTRFNRDKSNSKNDIGQLTSWIKDILSGITNELDAQQETIANLTTAVAEKDELIDQLRRDVASSLDDSAKLREKLYQSDLDRDLRLARLELSIQGAEHHDSLVQKVKDIEKWKENTSKVLSELSTRYP